MLIKTIKKAYKKTIDLSTINKNIKNMKTNLPYPMIKKQQEIKLKMNQYNKEYFFQKFEQSNLLHPTIEENINLYNLILGHLFTDNKRSFTHSILNDEGFKNGIKIKLSNSTNLLSEKIAFEFVSYYKQKLANVSNGFKGFKFVRENVAKNLEAKNQIETDYRDVYMLNGGDECFKFILELILENKEDGVMISKPYDQKLKNYLEFYGGNQIYYELDKKKNFKFCFENLVENFQKSVEKGNNIKAIFISNPHFPTGSVLEKKDVENLLNFAYEKNIILIINRDVAEIFYTKGKPEINLYTILKNMEEEKQKKIKMVFYESLSNGYYFSPGLKSGFMELRNFTKLEKEKLDKNLKNYTPNNYGQIFFDIFLKEFDSDFILMNSKENNKKKIKKIRKYSNNFYENIFYRIKSINSIFNKSETLNSYRPEGGYCFFPKIIFTKHFLEKCKKNNIIPDDYYCQKMMEDIGVCTVPGNLFGIDDEYRFMIYDIHLDHNSVVEIYEKIIFFNKKFFYDFENNF